ncbi:MAG: PAS domain-containing protein [Deltaproteobacteria bacterium]|nr:PAS domain-containing protein [Deltaproteobacteria bacterium]MBW2120964.1 PAS domain-containing protein [Deltaproteobacteria bacterium]
MGRKLTYKELEQRVKELERELLERRQAEEAMLETQERFRAVADFTFDWEYWISPEGTYVYVSPSCERITGYSPEEFQKDPDLLQAITHPQDRAAVSKHLQEELKSRGILSLDFRIIHRSGQERWIAHVCQQVFATNGDLLGRRASNRDITKRKQAEEALRQTHDELYRLSQELEKKVQERTEELQEKSRQLVEVEKLAALGKMANRVAHDLRNPLTIIGGFARRMYEKTPDDHPNKRYLRIIVKETSILENRISEIVDSN